MKPVLRCEDAIEPRPQHGLSPLARMAAVGLEISVELPDQLADGGLGGAVLVGEGVELVNQALGNGPSTDHAGRC